MRKRRRDFQRQKKYQGLRNKKACKVRIQERSERRVRRKLRFKIFFFLRRKESHGKSSAWKFNKHIVYIKGRESSQLLNKHEHYTNHCNVKRKNIQLSLRKYEFKDCNFLVFLINAQRRFNKRRKQFAAQIDGWLWFT